jgi:hypothetical protein
VPTSNLELLASNHQKNVTGCALCMGVLNYVTGVMKAAFGWLWGNTFAKTILVALVGILGYRTFNPVPSRELIIREVVVDPRLMVTGTELQTSAADIRPSSPALYVHYTIVCIPIDRGAVCDTAAHTFRFVASPGAAPEVKIAGQLAQIRHIDGVVDMAGRAVYMLDLPAQVSGKDVIEISAPIVGSVGVGDLKFESPTDGNLLEKKMHCQPASVGDGGMTQLCVEIPSFKERLAALFDFKLH